MENDFINKPKPNEEQKEIKTKKGDEENKKEDKKEEKKEEIEEEDGDIEIDPIIEIKEEKDLEKIEPKMDRLEINDLKSPKILE